MKEIALLCGVIFAVACWDYLNNSLPHSYIQEREYYDNFTVRDVAPRHGLREGETFYARAKFYGEKEEQVFEVRAASELILNFKRLNAESRRIDLAKPVLLLSAPLNTYRLGVTYPGKTVFMVDPWYDPEYSKMFGYPTFTEHMKKLSFAGEYLKWPFKVLGITFPSSIQFTTQKGLSPPSPYGTSISIQEQGSLLTCFPFDFSDWDVVVRPPVTLKPSFYYAILNYGSGCSVYSSFFGFSKPMNGDFVLSREDINQRARTGCKITTICLGTTFDRPVIIKNPPLLFMNF